MDFTQLAHHIASQYVPPETGRPSVIGDQETLSEFFAAVDAGNYWETAAEIAGISTETLRLWQKRADTGEEPFNAFFAITKKLERRAEALAVSRVRRAGEDPRFWAAEMTYLERRHPERWGRRNDPDSGSKINIFIGAGAEDVQRHLQIVALDQGNHNLAYQTQSLGEAETAQVLPAPYPGASEAKGEGRKSLPVAGPDVLDAVPCPPVLALEPFGGPQGDGVPGTPVGAACRSNRVGGKEKKGRVGKKTC